MAGENDSDPSTAWSSQVEILREVLRAPAAPLAERATKPRKPVLEAYLGQTFEGITVVAPDGRIRLFTAGLQQITGIRKDEVGSIKELVTALAPNPELGEEQWALLEAAMATEESQEALIEIVNRRGERRWLRGRVYRVNEDSLIHVIDITAIHKLRGTMPHSAEHHQALLDNLQVGIYSCDDPARGTLSFTNPAFRRILGFPEGLEAGQASPAPLYERPEDRGELLEALMADSLTHSRTVQFETRVLRVDDRRPVPVRATATVTYDEQGDMCRIDGALEDLTECKHNDLLLGSLFRDTAVGVAIGTTDGRFSAVNAAFCEMVGYSEAELLGHDSDVVTHPDDRGLSLKLIGEAIAAGKSMFSFDKRYVHKDGTVFPVSVVMAAVKDDTGRVVAGIGLFERIAD